MDDGQWSAVPSADEAGFRGWAAARLPALRRKAFLLCGDWHLADDLVQDTLVTVHARWPRLVRQGAPDAYSSRVLVSRFVDERRRPWRRESPHAALPEAPDARAGRALEAAEPFDRLLADALRAVPAEQRAVLVLRYADDPAIDEVAALLELSIGTVKSRASRGAQRLRAELLARGYEVTGDAVAVNTGGPR